MMPRVAVSVIVLAVAFWAAAPGLAVNAAPEDNPRASASGIISPGSSAVTPGSSGLAPSGYLASLYLWFLGFVGIAALFMIVLGGITYMFSGTSLTKTEQGRQWILNAVWGIVLAAFAVLLLRTINPDLVRGFNFDQIINRAVTRSVAPSQELPPPEF